MSYSCVEKKNCVIEELNKVTVATSDNTRLHHTLGLETRVPLIFLDTNHLESSDNLTVLDQFLPIIGDNYFIAKEQSDEFLVTPIVDVLEDECGVVASWDSSAHENSKVLKFKFL